MAFASTAPGNPYGTYTVLPTATGIRFQVSTHHPNNKWLSAGLILKSFLLAALAYDGFWNLLGTLALLLILDALFYLGMRRIQLAWIEVRPDGLAITPNINAPDVTRFFDRRAITQRHLDFDAGLTFRYGIYDVEATPPFANEREFDIFSLQLEQAISRLWHQQNL